MCTWEMFKKIFLKKKSSMEQITSSGSSLTFLQSPEQFYEELQQQLTEDNIRELGIAFRMIDISTQAYSKSLFRLMSKREFRRNFKEQLQKYQELLNKSDRKRRRTVSNSLKNHCFAILSTYLDMVTYLHDPAALNNFLEQLAISHSFISNPKASFEMHSIIFRIFMEKEFGRYMNRKTRRALKKFLKLITLRLRVLVEQQIERNDFDEVVQAMEKQKTVIALKSEEIAIIKEVYRNALPRFSSQYSLMPSEAVYPGTSRAARISLDRQSC